MLEFKYDIFKFKNKFFNYIHVVIQVENESRRNTMLKLNRAGRHNEGFPASRIERMQAATASATLSATREYSL